MTMFKLQKELKLNGALRMILDSILIQRKFGTPGITLLSYVQTLKMKTVSIYKMTELVWYFLTSI